MGQPLTQHTFAAGETSAESHGNTRNPWRSMALRTCKNFLPLHEGPLLNRSGTLDLGALASSSIRAEAFIFTDEQAFVLEFTPGKVRFWTTAGQVLAGGVPYEVATPYVAADLPLLDFAQSGDVVRITRRGYQPRDLSRISNTNWTLTAADTTPQAYFAGNPVHGRAVSPGFGGSVGVTGINNVWSNATTYALGDFVVRVAAADTKTHLYQSLIAGNLNHDPDGSPVQWYDWSYFAAAPAAYATGDYAWDPVDQRVYISLLDLNSAVPHTTPTAWAAIIDVTHPPKRWLWVITQFWQDSNGVRHETLPSLPTTAIQLSLWTDRPADVLWGAEAGGPASYKIIGYGVYRGRDGLFGFVGGTDAAARRFHDDGGAPNYNVQPPKGTNPFLIADGANSSSSSWPGASTFHDQRCVYAGTDTKPSSFFGSAASDINRFDRYDDPKSADSYEWKISSQRLENIRRVVSFGRLLFFSGQGVFSAHGADGTSVSPNAVEVRRQKSAGGSSYLSPIEVGEGSALLYTTSKGGRVRNLYFDFNSNAYVGVFLDRMVRHLFRGRTVVSWAYQEDPYEIVWGALDNGLLLSMRYDHAAQLVAVAQHPTAGTVKQLASIPNGTEDALMLGVVRNGSPRMEIMASRDYIPDDRLACFLDGARQFDGRNTGATTMKVTGASFDAGDIVTIDASVAAFAGTDVDDQVVIDPDGTPEVLDDEGEVVTEAIGAMRITVTQYNSATQVLGRLEVPLDPAYQNAPTTRWGWARDTLTGLGHLEGLSVTVLADSAVQGPFVVAGGQIGPLDPPACIATAGLSYNSDAELLDVASDAVKTNVKSVNSVTFDVVASRGISAGEDFDHLDVAKLRTVEDDYDPTEPITDQVTVLISSSWNKGGRACIRQSDPLPLTITAVTRDVEVGGRG